MAELESLGEHATTEPIVDPQNFYSYFAIVKHFQIPLIYSDKYNISFLGLEKLHPFDSCKYFGVIKELREKGYVKKDENIVPIRMPTQEMLLLVHTKEYLDSLKWSINVARITEVPVCAVLPNVAVKWRVLNPMLYATSGSILAGKLALEKGWSINLSGGYHHCCSYEGGGFCAYADITLSIHHLRKNFPKIKDVMIIDLDAHQGNGHERDKLKFQDKNLFILDMYNKDIYPGDREAAQAIDIAVPLRSGTKDTAYLTQLENAMNTAFSIVKPDIVYYNAGTDILEGDPLGSLDITANGVMTRDELVFKYTLERNIPIVMLLSGGYQKTNAHVIAESVINLFQKFNLPTYSPASNSKI
eukprot:TRINITY_DN5196_c0_g1_i1.p1 TRINITY_DN5196_c0_g1~~TRINITY_DN5196_c0_g1_i1.p1  ORF type:complete len:390 (+),score=55.87 TRINITY_DN5196_c0_g1_i1:98-1171(+)